MVLDECNQFSFWAIFCPFTPWTAPKKYFGKMKKTKAWDIFILRTCTKSMIRWCTVPNIRRMTDLIVICHFRIVFAFYQSNRRRKQNFWKMKKEPGYNIILHRFSKNYDQMIYCSWDMVRDRCNYFRFGVIFALLPL